MKVAPPRADGLESAEALIEEARRRHRKRRQLAAIAALAATGLAAGLLAALGGSPPAGRSDTSSQAHGRPPAAAQAVGDHAAAVSSIPVAINAHLSKLVVFGGQLIAYGSFDAPLSTKASCIEASVQPSPLKMLPPRSFDCTIPVPGEQAAATYEPLGGARFYNDDLVKANAQLQVARTNAATKRLQLGPAVMKFSGLSDSWPATVDTTSSVWAYDCATGGLQGGAAIQASAATGEIETSVSMPSVCHSSIGADAAGAFVASYDGGGPIYFVANGATRARVVLAHAGTVGWFYADGDSMYIAVGDQGAQSEQCQANKCGVWRFTGPDATPKLLANDRVEDIPTMEPVGGGSLGLLSVASQATTPASTTTTFHIISIDPSTGAQRTLASFRLSADPATPYNPESPSSLAFLGHSLYVLVPGSPTSGAGMLYRYRFS